MLQVRLGKEQMFGVSPRGRPRPPHPLKISTGNDTDREEGQPEKT